MADERDQAGRDQPGGADCTLAITSRVAVRADQSVSPEVFLIEAVSQALALAVGPAGAGPILRAVRSARFLAPVRDELTLDVEALAAYPGEWDVKATATCADGTVAAKIRADFTEAEHA